MNRICKLKDKENAEPMLFHTWEQISDVVPPSIMVGGHSGGTISCIVALVETKDGNVHGVPADNIQFIDGEAERVLKHYGVEGDEK